jgi:hypothetical protein
MKNFILIILIAFIQFSCGNNIKIEEKNTNESNKNKYPKEVIENVQAFCKKKYTKRGHLDQEMYDFMLKEHLKSYDELLILESKYKNYSWLDSYKNNIIKDKTKAGVTDWFSVNGSLESEIDFFLDLEYGLKNGEFDKEKYNLLYKEWYSASSGSYWGIIRLYLKD